MPSRPPIKFVNTKALKQGKAIVNEALQGLTQYAQKALPGSKASSAASEKKAFLMN